MRYLLQANLLHLLKSAARKVLLAIRFRGLATVGKDLKCHGPVVLLGRNKISLGDRVNIAGLLHVWGHGGVVIDNDVLIASHVAITSVSHDPNTAVFRDKNLLLPVKIGDNVWIGSHAFIDAGVIVGSGARVLPRLELASKEHFLFQKPFIK
jgi:acetyltransferase-like isoleucine patch superfamily enzyme